MARKQRNRLRVLRAERDITQMDLALKAKIQKDRYWRIENSYEKPSADEIARLAKALKAEPAELGFGALRPERAEEVA